MVGERRPLVEDTFSGRRPLLEDDLLWKTTCGGKRPSVEDNLRWILACFAAFFLLEDLVNLNLYDAQFLKEFHCRNNCVVNH